MNTLNKNYVVIILLGYPIDIHNTCYRYDFKVVNYFCPENFREFQNVTEFGNKNGRTGSSSNGHQVCTYFKLTSYDDDLPMVLFTEKMLMFQNKFKIVVRKSMKYVLVVATYSKGGTGEGQSENWVIIYE